MVNSNGFFSQIGRHSVALISLSVALTSLAYNTYRNELSEDNRNIRTASFALIEHLAALDELTISIRYSQTDEEMNTAQIERARKLSWVHVIAMHDLSYAMSEQTQQQAIELREVWQQHSLNLRQEASYDLADQAIESLRESVLTSIQSLD